MFIYEYLGILKNKSNFTEDNNTTLFTACHGICYSSNEAVNSCINRLSDTVFALDEIDILIIKHNTDPEKIIDYSDNTIYYNIDKYCSYTVYKLDSLTLDVISTEHHFYGAESIRIFNCTKYMIDKYLSFNIGDKYLDKSTGDTITIVDLNKEYNLDSLNRVTLLDYSPVVYYKLNNDDKVYSTFDYGNYEKI